MQFNSIQFVLHHPQTPPSHFKNGCESMDFDAVLHLDTSSRFCWFLNHPNPFQPPIGPCCRPPPHPELCVPHHIGETTAAPEECHCNRHGVLQAVHAAVREDLNMQELAFECNVSLTHSFHPPFCGLGTPLTTSTRSSSSLRASTSQLK